jgi:hypothetical protein
VGAVTVEHDKRPASGVLVLSRPGRTPSIAVPIAGSSRYLEVAGSSLQ